MIKFLKKIILREKYNSETFVKHLREIGCRIGEGTTFYDVRTIRIDRTRPWLIEIGNNVSITKGVTLLTHGYEFSVLINRYGNLYGSSGKVKIGDNVFIGNNTTILKGITIGNNVIIGADSLLNKDIPDNSVYAGNPAKFIMSLEEYEKKRKVEYIKEAKECVREFIKVYEKKPTHKDVREFFPLYLDRKDIEFADEFFIKMDNVEKFFKETKPIFNGLDDFIEESMKEY